MALTLEVTENGFIFHGKALAITQMKNQLLAPYRKMMHHYGVVLCLHPTCEQETKFRQFNGCARVVHNDYLEERGKYYKENKKLLSVSEYKKSYLPALKKEKPYLKEADKYALEAAIENVDKAFKNFFEGRAKYPKMTSRRKPSGNKYTTKQNVSKDGKCSIRMYGEKRGDDIVYLLHLPKVGAVEFVIPKKKDFDSILPPGAKITKVTVTQTSDGKWTASLAIETVIDLVEPFKTVDAKDILSGDLGIKEFLIYGGIGESSEHIENPRFIEKHAKKLRRAQKKLSRRKYDSKTHEGSKNREKARLDVAKEHRKLADQRKDFHHKESTKIAKKCKFFLAEDLNVKGMMKNHKLSKSIASVGWGQFLTFLDYKLKRKGGGVIKIDRFYPSSQLCHCCGYKNVEVKDLSVRAWTCPSCGKHHDRDENAQKNIWREGVRLMQEEHGIIVLNVPALIKTKPAVITAG